MKQQEAERRAKKIWGERYMVADRQWADPYDRYAVGYSAGGLFMIRGKGRTWEDAFASIVDADVVPR